MGIWLKRAAMAGAAGAALAVVGYVWVLPKIWVPAPSRVFSDISGDAKNGEALVRTGGCVVCHTDTKNKGELFAGGSPLKTPFGTFYGSNLTPDPETGIGKWTLAEFSNALTAGISPEGEHYYPVFPYTNYTLLKNQDIADIKAYLDTVPAVSKPSIKNDLVWPFSDRKLMGGWKWLFFEQGEYVPDTTQTVEWNRGAYLVQGPTHCGVCHTDLNIFGARTGERLVGNPAGPDGDPVPGINARVGQIKDWTIEDITFALQTGLKPDGDVMGRSMGRVVEYGTSYMSDEDLKAMAVYLLSFKQKVKK